MYLNEQFCVSAIDMNSPGTFNPDTKLDNKLFVDPKLLHDGKDEFSGAHDELQVYFTGVVTLIKLSSKIDDIPWITACKLMEFKETSNTCLGFSKEGALYSKVRVGPNSMEWASELILSRESVVYLYGVCMRLRKNDAKEPNLGKKVEKPSRFNCAS